MEDREAWSEGGLGAAHAMWRPTPTRTPPHHPTTAPPSPQGVRSLSRFYLLFFIPIFMGPYWSWVAQTVNFAFAFFYSIIVSAQRALP